MKEFRVTLTHHSGELARLTHVLAEHRLDLRSVAGFADSNKAHICLVAEDVAAMRETLTAHHVRFTERELLSELVEDEIGAVADLTAKLAQAGIDIQSLYILARDTPLVEIGLTVDNPKKAKKVLG